MKDFPLSLSVKLEERINANSLRTLPNRSGLVDFSSNDYLGFAVSSDIFKDAHQYLIENNLNDNGATGSRLISGNHKLYNLVEEQLCAFHKCDSALIFNSGYDANIGLLSSLLQKGDIILYDEYSHASIRDGIRLSYAQAYKFRHNNIEALKELLMRYREKANSAAEVYIVTESVFSMDGDSPDLKAMARLATEFGARLIIDEAHALGVIGLKGEGLVQSLELQNEVFARVVTFGKGLGCHGAAVLGTEMLKSYLVNFARSFIYTTGLPPASLATIHIAYNYLNAEDGTQKQLLNNIKFFNEELNRINLKKHFIESNSAIQSAVIPGNDAVKIIALALQREGFDVRAILSPTVAWGNERLRFCLHSYNIEGEITKVLELLKANLQSRV